MKTWVRIKDDIHQEPLKKDDIGYIDGWLRAADDRPYAAVVVPNKYIGLASAYELEPIDNQDETI